MVIDRRIGAFLIDLIIIGSLSFVAFAAVADYDFTEFSSLADSEARCELHNDNGTDGVCVPVETGALVVRFTRLLSPIVFHLALWLLRGAVEGITGWSPGKLMTGIRVVNAGGSRIGSVKGVIRALLLPIDGFPWGAPMLVAMMVASNNSRQQRLGDIATESFVVHKLAAGAFVTEPLMLDTPLPTPVPALAPLVLAGSTGRPALLPGPVVMPTEPPLATELPPPPATFETVAPPGPARPLGMSYDESRQAYVWAEPDRLLIWDDSTQVWRNAP